MKSYEKGARSAETATERLEKRMRSLDGLARRAAIGIGIAGAALVAIGADSVRAATEFESNLSQINTLVGVSRSEIDGYRESILNLAPAVGRGPSELARAMFAITSAGARGEKALETLEASARAAAIGLGDTRDIALSAVAAVTAFGDEALTTTEAVETMVGIVEQGNLEASSLASSLGNVLSVASSAGVTLRDAGAFIAAFTRQGVSAEQAVTGLRGTLAILVREPTAAAEAAFKRLGTSAEEFRRQVADEGFINSFQELVNRAQAAGVNIGELIPEVEALAGSLAVFTSKGESAADIAEKIGDAVGTLTERFRAAAEQDPALAFAMLGAKLETLRVQLGIALLPAVTKLLEEFRGAPGEVGLAERAFISLGQVIISVAEGVLSLVAGFTELKRLAVSAVSPVVGALDQAADNFRTFAVESVIKLYGDDLPPRFQELGRRIAETSNAAFDAGKATREMNTGYLETLDLLFGLRDGLEKAREELGKSAEASGENADEAERLAEATRLANSAIETVIQNIPIFGQRARDAARDAEEAANSTVDWAEKIRDLEAELGGPLAQAFRDYQRQVQEVVAVVQEFPQEADQAVVVLDLLRQQYEQNAAAIRDDLLVEIDNLMGESGQLIRMFFGIGEAAEEAAESTGGFGSMLSEVGSGFAQSIFQGQGIQSALSSAFLGVGGQMLTQGLEESIQTATEDGLSAAFESDGFLNDAAAGFAVAIGQAVGGSIGQAAFTAAGTAIGAAFGGKAGAQIGSAIGSILGDLFFGESVPKFQARGTRATTATDAGTDLVLDTDFGDFELAFRELTDEQRRAVTEAYTSFFNFLGDLTGGLLQEQQERIANVIQEFGISSRSGPDSPEGQMKLLLEDIVATFPPFFAELVNAEATLDERLAKFADLLSLENIVGTGRGLEGLGFEETARLLNDVARAGETLTQALARVEVGFDALTRLGQLTGNALRDSTEGLARLSADLSELFGGDADAIASRFRRIFETFFSEEENLEATIATAGGLGEQLLRDLLGGIEGIDFSEEFLTRSGFAGLLEQLTAMELSPEQLAILAEAGVNIADLIEAEERLAEIRGEAAENARDEAAIARILEDLELDATRAGLEGLDLALFNLDQRQEEVIATLEEAGATAEEIAQAEALFGEERARIVEEFNQRALEAERERLERLDETIREAGLAALEVLAPMRVEFANLNERLRDSRQAAIEAGASEEQLAGLRFAARIQLEAFAEQLRASIEDTNERLFGTAEAAESTASTLTSGINTAAGAARNFRDQWLAVVEQINTALDAQLLGTSTLTAPERLAEAERQFFDALAAAEGGDLGAAQNLTALFDQAISEGAGFFGSTTTDFAELEGRLRSALENADLPIPPESPERQTATNTGRTARAVEDAELSRFEQIQLATQLVSQLELLSRLTGDTPTEIGEEFGIPISELIGVLTGQVPDLTGDALSTYFDDLVFETGRQLDEMAELEQTASNILGEAQAIRALLERAQPEADKFPQSTGPTEPPLPGKGGGETVTGSGQRRLVATVEEPRPIEVEVSTAELTAALSEILAELRESTDQRRTLIRETSRSADATSSAIIRLGDRIVRSRSSSARVPESA